MSKQHTPGWNPRESRRQSAPAVSIRLRCKGCSTRISLPQDVQPVYSGRSYEQPVKTIAIDCRRCAHTNSVRVIDG
jgi:hypothetical protein